MSESLVINEIYLSLQGESTFAGLPCVFVRTTACNLRCSYCDTAYAFREGKRLSFGEIEQRVAQLATPYPSSTTGQKLPLIEFTGGEPLLQPGSAALMKRFCDQGYTLLVETSGAWDIAGLDPRIHRIMDMKCPSSGEVEKNLASNIAHLKQTDEVKFVIGTEEDYQWAKEQTLAHRLHERCPVLYSWVAPLQSHQRDPSLKEVPEGHQPISRVSLVERIVSDALPVRFQLQMHKFIWPVDQKGV
ncbi:MAG: radical SAM protein [Verrucomicrobiales bacterium]